MPLHNYDHTLPSLNVCTTVPLKCFQYCCTVSLCIVNKLAYSNHVALRPCKNPYTRSRKQNTGDLARNLLQDFMENLKP